MADLAALARMSENITSQAAWDAFYAAANLAINELTNYITQQEYIWASLPGGGVAEREAAWNQLRLAQDILSAGSARWGEWQAAHPPYTAPPPPQSGVPTPIPAPRYGLTSYNYEDYIVDYKSNPITDEEYNRVFIDEIGGVELAQISTFNTIKGTNHAYTLVSGLDKIDLEGDPMRLISSQAPDESYFNLLTVDFDTYFVETTTNPLLTEDSTLEIMLAIDDPEMLVEIEIDSNGTIYEIDEAV